MQQEPQQCAVWFGQVQRALKGHVGGGRITCRTRCSTAFLRGTSFTNEVIAAGACADLAYIVALEHTTVSIDGAAQQPNVLRVTTVFRREDDDWTVVHRHGDTLTSGHNDDVTQQLLSGARLNVAQRASPASCPEPAPAGR